MGCLFPRFDLRNAEFFVEKLNEHLEKLVREYKNAYILDVDRIAASLGRRFVQDDIVAAIGHNSLAPTASAIANRIEPTQDMTTYFEITWPSNFREVLWSEIVAMHRTVRQIDCVKLVVVDLDDTLWNGVSGDIVDIDPVMVEGWPLGLAEALCYLKKRGILLAVISKNDEQRIRDIWPKIFRGRLRLEDFAAIRINWRAKAENLAEILGGMNLLPRNVVFVDDNPVERAAIKRTFPDVRVLGRHPYYLRQTLLWSSETQVVSVTAESSRRTEMVKSQLDRECRRAVLSRDSFLKEAAPIVQMILITTPTHPRFTRAFELINKTNQFNTTGRRWTAEEIEEFFEAGGAFHAFEVEDAYTGYGLVGAVIVKNAVIVQWVMSCRILGYQIEEAVMATVVPAVRASGAAEIRGYLVETDVNFPCRDLFAKSGFIKTEEMWMLPSSVDLALPEHVTMRTPPIST
jgi:FkbH-like protein